MAVQITAELWDATNSTWLYQLSYASNHRWQEVLNDCGTWSIDLPYGDPALSSATYGRVVRFLVDGDPAFAGQIEQRELRIVAQGEETEQTTTLSGRGLLSRWEDAVVYPKGGLDQKPQSDLRPLNWCYPENPFFLGWPYVYVRHDRISRQINTDPPLHEPWFPPKGWPPPVDCCWVWSSNRGNYTPPGRCLFIYVYNAPADMDLVMWLAADNHATLYVDGIQVMETDAYPSFAFEDGYRTVVPISAGYHAIGIEAEVYETSPNGLYRGMVALSAHQLPTDGSPLSASSSVFKTDATWQCLDYPTTVPGQTAGGVLQVLLLEAQARGALTGWTKTFDNLTDSAGDPWPWMYEENLNVGQDYLSVIKQMSEEYCDVTIDPVGLKIHAYIKGGAGTSAAVYQAGVNLTELIHTEQA